MNRKKLVALIMVLALAFTTLVGGTLAYFTDTDDATNVFTSGNVDIDLTEAVVEPDSKGNLVATDERVDVEDDEEDVYDYGKLFPGMTVDKDPTITVAEDSENVFLAAKITVKNDGTADLADTTVLGTGYEGLINIKGLVSGGFVDKDAEIVDTVGNLPVYGDGETYMLYQEVVNGEFVFHLLFLEEMEAGDSVVLFEKLTVPATWDNAEMDALKGLEIKIEAYAVQSYGFEGDALAAIEAAFKP